MSDPMQKVFLALIMLACAGAMFRAIWESSRMESERVCRHTIQRNFGIERAEVERMMREQEARER